MKEFNYVITDQAGIHARPAGLLVSMAKECSSIIMMEVRGQRADVARLMSVMQLSVRQGDEVRITVEGENEEVDCQYFKTFFQDNL